MNKQETKLSRGVALVGAGMSKLGAFPDKTSRDLFVEAFVAMAKSVDKWLRSARIVTPYTCHRTLYAPDVTEKIWNGYSCMVKVSLPLLQL